MGLKHTERNRHHISDIISCSLYIFKPIFEDYFFVFKNFFSKKSYVIKSNLKSRAGDTAHVQYIDIMPIPVMEFSKEGYKIRKIFGKKSTVFK